ncbi:hypothetical protein AVP42_02130 [Agromyces sp. NDB4Y10]|uniref:hypothetical protein n=1 Tax=Agromyces sp. NDB4Y10 TaxID=1775951 RepID=UPI0007B28692|nr:hypothetical protein [Agromyces sp. NDB4Y10]KZE92864.1 hypothetical protein AVP42_02130 [Agromyces sp. NDB4Y10]
MKSPRAFAAALILAAGAVAFTAAPAYATPDGTNVCPEFDTGHLSANGEKEWTAVAPEGQLIAQICVKAGSAKQGLGPELITLDPYAESVTFRHSSGKDISHYSVAYVEVTETMPPATPGDGDPAGGGDPVGGGDGDGDPVGGGDGDGEPVVGEPIDGETDPIGGGDGETDPVGGGEATETKAQLAATGFENGWLLFAGFGAIVLGGGLAATRIVAAKRR